MTLTVLQTSQKRGYHSGLVGDEVCRNSDIAYSSVVLEVQQSVVRVKHSAAPNAALNFSSMSAYVVGKSSLVTVLLLGSI